MTQSRNDDALAQQLGDWWQTGITDIRPGEIRMRGYPIQDLIGNVGFVGMAWLMLRGELPSGVQSRLLEAAMVAGVDHGPHAPSIAIARMAATCGIGINGAMASAANVLGDVHGGAGQACLELYDRILRRAAQGEALPDAARREVDAVLDGGAFIAGFGHRFHPVDPRAGRLLGLVEQAAAQPGIDAAYVAAGRAVEDALAARKGKRLPMNIDGATAVVYGALGFAPELARGLFVLSRSVGILAHAWEQTHTARRIKGPMPPSVPYHYTGPSARPVPEGDHGQ